MIPFDHIDFKSLIGKEANGRMRVRLMALSQILERSLIIELKVKQQTLSDCPR